MAGAVPLRAACLLLVPGLGGVLGFMGLLLLHALCLLGCCLSSIVQRQAAIVLKEPAPFSKVAHVGICSQPDTGLGVWLSCMHSGVAEMHMHELRSSEMNASPLAADALLMWPSLLEQNVDQ